jgi:hypothetical protein
VTDSLDLVEELDGGKLFETGDDKIRVLQLKGSWYEMGQQYGALVKGLIDGIYKAMVQDVYDKKLMTEEEATELFGTRVFGAASTRRQQLYRGVADGLGWPVEKVVVLDQSGFMSYYQAKLHAFAGCSTLFAWGDATDDGRTYTGRNQDWGKAFVDFPLVLTVYNPTDGSNGIANMNWAGWMFAMTAINDKGVYVDLHDGTAMGGQVVAAERPSIGNAVFDFLAECHTAEDVGNRFNGTRPDICLIWDVADPSGNCFSYETTLTECRRRRPEGTTFVSVNTFQNPDWGLYTRDTASNSLRRFQNLVDRSADVHGRIDAENTMGIMDIPLFNEDGTFKENGGATKPTIQDVDLTNYSMVTIPDSLDIWLKIPVPQLKTDWRHIDLKQLFV